MTMRKTTYNGDPAAIIILERSENFHNDGFCMGFLTTKNDYDNIRIFIGQIDVEEDGCVPSTGNIQMVLVYPEYAYDVMTERLYWEDAFQEDDYCTENFVLKFT